MAIAVLLLVENLRTKAEQSPSGPPPSPRNEVGLRFPVGHENPMAAVVGSRSASAPIFQVHF